jgi:hypothetical protein
VDARDKPEHDDESSAMTDYWLSKLCFDLQDPGAAAAYRRDRESVLRAYALKPEVRAALDAEDVAALVPYVNAYLLRFYFVAVGMPDDVFMQKLGPRPQHG